jgi:hypothetical protein
MEKREFVGHSAFFLIVLGLAATGIFVDNILAVPTTDIQLSCPDGVCRMKISGIRLSSSRLVLDYNKCTNDPERVGESRLYSRDGVEFKELVDGKSRDASIVEFAHLNIHEEGTEIIGDIGLTEERAQFARKLAFFALILISIAALLFVLLRKEPLSIFSKQPDGVPSGVHLYQQVVNWFILAGAGVMWLSIVGYSATIPTLLAHLFREARDRCDIEYKQTVGEHYEMRSMGAYVRDNANPSGLSILMFSLCVSLLFLYTAFLFIRSNGKGLNLLQLSSSQGRSLPWYCKVWPWKFTIVVTLFGMVVTFWVMNVTKTRGYLINNFYWTYGSKVAQKTGLSRTGTLLDFAQKILSLVAVPENVMAATTYMWLVIVPVLAAASFRPLSLFLKGCQDFAILLIIRAMIAWVTIAPTTLSMLEKPECFEQPDEDNWKWAWLVVFDGRQSCNDTMFSITVAVVGMQAVVLIYYGMFSGLVGGIYAVLVYGYICLSAVVACVVAVVSRHQYSSDIVIGICIVVVYMLTQMQPYRLLFEGDSVDVKHPNKILREKVLPTLEDCVTRVKSYSQASKELRGLKASTSDFEEMALLYRSVGQAIQRARFRSPATSQNIDPRHSSNEAEDPLRLQN